MSFLDLKATDLEKELTTLDVDENNTISSTASLNHSLTSTSTSASASIKRAVGPDGVSLFGPGVGEFWKKKTKIKRLRKGLTKGKILPDHVVHALGLANAAFISGNLSEAESMFNEVVKIAPKLPDPYISLSNIYEKSNDLKSALRVQLVVAKLSKSYDMWCKVLDLCFELKEYKIALDATSRALHLKPMDPVMLGKRVLLFFHMGNFTEAENRLSFYLQQQMKTKRYEDLKFLLYYGFVCCEHGEGIFGLRAFMTFIRISLNVTNRDEGDRNENDESSAEEEEEEEDSEDDASDENESDNEKGPAVETEHSHEERVEDLFTAAKGIFSCYIDNGLLRQRCRVDTSESCLLGSDEHDLTSAHATSDVFNDREQELLAEFAGILVFLYSYFSRQERPQATGALASSEKESNLDIEISSLPLDVQILYCLCRIGMQSRVDTDRANIDSRKRGNDTNEDEDDEDGADDFQCPFSFAARLFIQKLPLSTAITALVTAFNHLNVEERFISRSLTSYIASMEASTQLSKAEAQVQWLRDNVIIETAINSEDRLIPDLPIFSLDQWHFFISARVYTAQTLFFDVGMKREALKIMDKLLQCPLIVVDRDIASQQVLPSSNFLTEQTPSSAFELLEEACSPVSLIRVGILRNVWNLQFEIQFAQHFQQPHPEDERGVQLLQSCISAVQQFGVDDSELLLLLTCIVRKLPPCPDRYRRVHDILETRVMRIVSMFDSLRSCYMMEISKSDDDFMKKTGLSKHELFLQLRVIMAWIEIGRLLSLSDNTDMEVVEMKDEGPSQMYFAVVFAFLVAVYSPPYKRYIPRYHSAPSHMNDGRKRNNSTALVNVFGNRKEESRTLLKNLTFFRISSMSELSALISQAIGYSLYRPDDDMDEVLKLKMSTLPPLDIILERFAGPKIRKIALCVFSMSNLYGKLRFIVNLNRSNTSSEWWDDFAPDISIQVLTKSIEKTMKDYVRRIEETKPFSSDEIASYSTYIHSIFSGSIEPFSMKRKYGDSDLEVGDSYEGDGDRGTTVLSRGAKERYVELVSMPEAEMQNPVDYAGKFSMKLREFVHSASMISTKAAKLAYALCQWPDDVAAANNLSREVVQIMYSDTRKLLDANCSSKGTYLLSESCNLHLSPFYRFFPNCTLGHLYRGNELLYKGKTVESLDNYLKAFRNSPTQPLVALCVATTLLSLASSHPKVKQRREVCAKGLAFFCCYSEHRERDHRERHLHQDQQEGELQIRKRLNSSNGDEVLREKMLEQEVLYNMGCIYRDMQFNHFAVEFFEKALSLNDHFSTFIDPTVNSRCDRRMNFALSSPSTETTVSPKRLPLTSEAAHNLVLIHKQSGNKAKALLIMKQYLMFDKDC